MDTQVDADHKDTKASEVAQVEEDKKKSSSAAFHLVAHTKIAEEKEGEADDTQSLVTQMARRAKIQAELQSVSESAKHNIEESATRLGSVEKLHEEMFLSLANKDGTKIDGASLSEVVSKRTTVQLSDVQIAEYFKEIGAQQIEQSKEEFMRMADMVEHDKMRPTKLYTIALWCVQNEEHLHHDHTDETMDKVHSMVQNSHDAEKIYSLFDPTGLGKFGLPEFKAVVDLIENVSLSEKQLARYMKKAGASNGFLSRESFLKMANDVDSGKSKPRKLYTIGQIAFHEEERRSATGQRDKM